MTDELVYLPIRHGVSVFAMGEDLGLPPDPRDVPRSRLARLKEASECALGTRCLVRTADHLIVLNFEIELQLPAVLAI
jgi:hypothetical protein